MILSIFAACRCLVLGSMPRPEVSKTNILNANLIYDFIVLDLYLLNIDKTRFNSNVSSSLSRLSIEIEAPVLCKQKMNDSKYWKEKMYFKKFDLKILNIAYCFVCIHALIKHLFVFIPSHNLQYYTESIHSTVQGFCCNI